MVRIVPNRHQPQQGVAWAYDVSSVQDAKARDWNSFYAIAPPADGVLLESVSIPAVAAVDVNHKLSRALRGWMVVRDSSVPCAFEATLSATMTSGAVDATFSKVEYDTEVVDVGEQYDAASVYGFTAPFDGIFALSASARISTVPDQTNIAGAFFKNATQWRNGNRFITGDAGYGQVVAFVLGKLEQGDVIDFRVYQDGGSNEDIETSTGTHFSGHAVDWLRDGQEESGVDQSKILRLYSSIARTVDLWVF